MVRYVWHDHRPVCGQHQLKDTPRSRKLAHGLAPVGFDPHSALIGKAEQHGVGLEIVGGQARDGVVAWLGLGIQNFRGLERQQARDFFTPLDPAGV